ncbi:MAG: hypothetical protein FWH46_05945 [Methanimicrococcus sp.]|nr:hypothetical protein [Methanimicrococcus sp.]
MLTYKCKKIEGALLSKGFRQVNKNHHKYFFYYDEEGRKQHFFTYTSHSNQEYFGRVLNKMKEQLKLDFDEFDGVVECYISKDQLKQIYSKKEKQQKI